ncbi:MAG TPA: ABC transporter substrate-binding protein [Tessaracoccus flavescens]|uniref:ABC transporter substrate-binding protein n=1 Tax=Tessaracoccus flavescens TaxID=399497 RepID=A0A921ERE2_9ACTN|nr:ABC transporter substrate-binding protein [Tessaracoccus flavescens]
MINRRTFLTAAALTAAVGAVGCSRTSPQVTDGAITVGLTYIPNVQFSAFYLGVAEGLFSKRGLDVTLRHHGQQEDVFGAVLSGQENVVFASADEGVVAAARGQDLRTFATSYQQYPNVVLSTADGVDPAAGLAALKGRSLGIPGHFGSSYYAALAALHTAGLTESDVKLVDIGYTQLSALASRQVDFVVGFRNNELVQLRGQGIEPTVFSVSPEGAPTLVGPSLITAGAAVADDVLKATSELWQIDGAVSVAPDAGAFERMGAFLRDAGVIDTVPENTYIDLGL